MDGSGSLVVHILDQKCRLNRPLSQVGGQAVLGRQSAYATPWLTERHGYDPTSEVSVSEMIVRPAHQEL